MARVAQSLENLSAAGEVTGQPQDQHRDLLALVSNKQTTQGPVGTGERNPVVGGVSRYGGDPLTLPLALTSQLYFWSQRKFNLPKYCGDEVCLKPEVRIKCRRWPLELLY